MSDEDLVGLLIPLTFLALLALEALARRRDWPALRWWRARGFAFFLMLMSLNALLPLLLPPAWTAHHLFDGARLGIAGGVLLAFPVLTLANALVHRAYHRYDLLWRWFHQLHHAPQRLDIPGSVLFTPQEIIVNIAVFQLIVVFVLGLDPLAAAVAGYIAAFYGMFQHLNVRTPAWLGYLIQRPESHAVHHRRGVHAYNYSDLPLWDLLWGTFRNPRQFLGEVGFETASDARMLPMFVGHDANAALYGPGSRGRAEREGNPA